MDDTKLRSEEMRIFRRSVVFHCAAALMGAASVSAFAVEIGGNHYTADATLTGANTWHTNSNVGVDAGVTVTVAAGATLDFGPAGNKEFRGEDNNGAGTLLIEGVFEHSSGVRLDTFWDSGTGSIIEVGNGGVYRFNTAGGELRARTYYIGAQSGGTFEVDLPNATDQVTISGGDGNYGNLQLMDGSKVDVKQGIVRILGNASNETSNIGNVEIAVSADGKAILEGTKSNRGLILNGPVHGTGPGWVELKGNFGIKDALDTMIIDFDDSSGDASTGGALINGIFLNGGNTLINRGKAVQIGQIDSDWTGSHNGELIIEGDPGDVNDHAVWYVTNNNTRINSNLHVQVKDRGSFIFMTDGAYQLKEWDSQINVHDGGVLATEGFTGVMDLNGDNTSKNVWVDIKDGGTVRVAADTELQIDAGIRIGGVNPTNNLSAGHYEVAGILDMNGRSNSGQDRTVGANKFDVIGQNASVHMNGAAASFDAIDSVTQVDGKLMVSNGYTFTPNGGTLNIGATGYLGGDGGVIDGNVISAGTTSPGLSPGQITIAGNYTENGLLMLQVFDLPTGTESDLLMVGGDAQINGLMEVNVQGFDPASLVVGDTWDLIMAQNIAFGSYSIDYTAFGTDYGFDLQLLQDAQLGDKLQLVVTQTPQPQQDQVAAVPEPTTAGTALLAMLGLSVLRRRSSNIAVA